MTRLSREASQPGLANGYYGQPAMKPSPWDYKVPAYVTLVGAGGAAQILAASARAAGNPRYESVVRNGRIMGLGTAVAGAPLLIADLKTPQRFFNMLRILRPTSPMSIGSFLLTGFGALSAATVGAEMLRGSRSGLGEAARGVGEAAQVPAAVLGAGMSTYTAALLASTSVPLWQAAPNLLGARFGASAFASASAALSLAEHAAGDPHGNGRRLDAVTLVASAAGLLLSVASDRSYRRQEVDKPLTGTPEGKLDKLGSRVIGQAAPLALLAINALSRRPSRGISMLASAGVIAGSFALRHAIMSAEKASAQSPEDYLRLASGETPRLPADDRVRLNGSRRPSLAEAAESTP